MAVRSAQQALRKDDFLMLLSPNGTYRYGFILETQEDDQHVTICMHDEGESKAEYEKVSDKWNGVAPKDFGIILSEREKTTLTHIANGVSNNEIAKTLRISAVTVRYYVRNLKMKLQVQNRDQLYVYAQGIVRALDEEESDE